MLPPVPAPVPTAVPSSAPAPAASARADVRARIIAEAARLLQEQGPAGVTTRGVAQGAGVQAPTIYRLFGDKDGLLDAVAEHVLQSQVSAKAALVASAAAAQLDPVEDLWAGWRAQIAFGLANPAVFRLLHHPDRARDSAAARAGREVLRVRVHRVAMAGRLRVGERRAVELIHAAGTGVIQTLLAAPPQERDPELADAMFGAVLTSVLTTGDGSAVGAEEDPTAAAVALRARAPQLEALTGAERRLLAEWLDRVIRD